jgi:hypothetical protein
MILASNSLFLMPAPTNSSAQPQGVPRANAQGYEKSDLAAKWIFSFFAALFIGAIAIHFLIGWQLGRLRKEPPPVDRWTGPRRAASSSASSPGDYPRLQLSPAADMEAFRAREEAELNSYGWVNRTEGVARIPINRAMELLLQKGLPVRAGTNGNKTGPSNLELQQQRPSQAEQERGRR